MLSNLMRHFWSSPGPRREQNDAESDTDDAVHAQQQQQRPSETQLSSDGPTDATSASASEAASSPAAVVDEADDPMEISFMHTPASTGHMPITPFVTQPTLPTFSRPSPVPFNLPRSSGSASSTGRRIVPPVPIFATAERRAAEPALTAALGARGRPRGRFEAPDRDDDKETTDQQPTTQPFTVRVEDETQRTSYQYTSAGVVEDEEKAPAQYESSPAAAAAEKDTRKRKKRDSSDMVDIDDDFTHTAQSPQPQPTDPATASPASATSTDDEDMPRSIKKLRIADDSPSTPTTWSQPASSPTASAAPRKRDSLTSLLNGVTMGWYSSLYNKMHGAPTGETILQAGLESIGLKEDEAAEEGKDERGGARMDEVKRFRSDKRDKQLKERQQEKGQRQDQGEGKSRAGVKQERAPHKQNTAHNQSATLRHTTVEHSHEESTSSKPSQQQRVTPEERKDGVDSSSGVDSRETRDDREQARAGPKAQVKDAAEEARRKRIMQGAERRRQGREHTLLEKREIQRKREEEARREAEMKEQEEADARKTEDEQRRRQAELLEQARAMQKEREEREEKERQKAAGEQRERENIERRETEAQRQREKDREKQQEREQQQQRQRAADKENIHNLSRPATTSTEDTPRRSTRLSSMQHSSKPFAPPAADDSISARLHARRVEKDERDRAQQQERDERERLIPHIERSVRQRARGRDYVGLVREFAPQLLEGKGRVVGGEVRKVLRRCMALYHPDKWTTRSVRERVESEHVFAVMQRAYEECGS